MNVYTDEALIVHDPNTVVTVGTFDGLHLGHKYILAEVVQKAKELNARTFVITFEPHPRKVLAKDNNIKLLNSPEEKKKFFELNGIDNVFIVNFTEEFSQTPSSEFVTDLIVSKIGISHFVVGYDHKFGKGRGGDENLLRELGKKHGFTVSTVGPVKIDNETIGSRLIRQYLAEGNLEKANKFLDYNYSLRGTVVEGDKRGRTIGFPTANIGKVHPDKLIPKNGVYVVKVKFGGETFGGMMNIGYRPTFKNTSELIMEVFIFDFDKNIYNIEVEIEFLKYLRAEKKFSSVDELIKQLNKDKEEAKKFLSN